MKDIEDVLCGGGSSSRLCCWPGLDTFKGGSGWDLFVPGADQMEVRSGSLGSMDRSSYVNSSMEPERKDWLKDFLTEVAARAYNPFEPKDKIKIKIFEE